MHEQTIWLPPRATAFTEICEACEEEAPGRVRVLARRRQRRARLDADHGWATCARGHEIRVLRMNAGMPAGALS